MERVRQMNEKMNVLDVQLDNCTAKDAMKIIAEYMQTEELNTVDIVTVDTLMRATQLDGMKEELEKLDLLLPGDMAILEAAKITDRKRIQEMEDQTMLKMVFAVRYLYWQDLRKKETDCRAICMRHTVGFRLSV